MDFELILMDFRGFFIDFDGFLRILMHFSLISVDF